MVTHANRVRIGKAQTEFARHLAMVLDDDVALASDILPWRANFRKHAADKLFFQFSIDHQQEPSVERARLVFGAAQQRRPLAFELRYAPVYLEGPICCRRLVGCPTQAGLT
jgi:hypothetical protein